MKHLTLMSILALACVLPAGKAFAQIGVTLEFPKTKFIQYEAIDAKVKLRNFGGQTLIFGTDQKLSGNLRFDIRDPEKRRIPILDDDVKLLDGLIIGPGETQEVQIHLSGHYDLTAAKNYDIKAYVNHPSLGRAYESKEQSILVTRGNTEWIMEDVGLPNYMLQELGPNDDRNRTYRIASVHQPGRKQLYIYVEDSQMLYSMRNIGYMMFDEKLVAETDNLGSAHILIPLINKEYRYVHISLDGELIEGTVYISRPTIPVLVRDKASGRVRIVGGTAKE